MSFWHRVLRRGDDPERAACRRELIARTDRMTAESNALHWCLGWEDSDQRADAIRRHARMKTDGCRRVMGA